MSEPAASGRLRVSRLFIHPVKGLASLPVERLELDAVGPVGDRRWMVVDPAGARFLNQRSHPRMALVRAEPIPGRTGGVRLAGAGAGSVDVPEPPADGRRMEVPIWDDRVRAVVASDEASRWLSGVLGEPVVLVRLPDDSVRSVAPTGTREGFANRVAFADDFPIHLVTEASVHDIDRRIPEGGPSIGPERFRPNVVIEGARPWEEDRWRRIRVGSVEIAVAKPRARCVITTVDPSTAAVGAEPLATLNGFRRSEGKVWVGQNALHAGPGAVRVGDPVVVLDRGEPRPGTGLAETMDRGHQYK